MNLSSFFPSSFKKQDEKDDKKEASTNNKKKVNMKSFMPTSFGSSSISNKKKTNNNKRKKEEMEDKNIKEEKEEMEEEYKNKKIMQRISPPRDDQIDEVQTVKEDRETKTRDSIKIEEQEEEQEEDDRLPISHVVKLRGHEKGITALAMEKSGARLLSGSYDMSLKYWDFNGMDRTMRPFRAVEPDEGHPINSLDYSDKRGRLLVAKRVKFFFFNFFF